jgi:hypothetical protein
VKAPGPDGFRPRTSQPARQSARVDAFHPAMSAIEPQVAQSSGDDIARWRLSELVRAGYTWDQGIRLACCENVDLHRAVDLLKRGCPPETALRILL